MRDRPDLTALLGSRICHDLISPLGAIGNGVELLMMDSPSVSPEMALISESVASANARIRYFRVAFGAASADQRMGRPEITSILADTTKGGRLTVDWLVAGDLPRLEVKLAFLALQCLESAMPWGGRVSVDNDGRNWHLTGTARRLKVEPALWDLLKALPVAPTDVSPAQVHFALLSEEAERQARRMTTRLAETEIVLSF
ncbi:MAG: histidine phosphotransferase family protein [Gemmobacter sp.]|nr:histidine phosphotransferase family protein [Gemmobacter sp.]